MIDIDELIQFDKAGCEHSCCTFGIHTLPKIIAELRAAREVVEAARLVLDLEAKAKGNKKYSDFLAHRYELESSLKRYDEERRG